MEQRSGLEKGFGKVVRRARREAGLSQEKLAFLSGPHPTYISLVERGLTSPSLKAIVRLATALGRKPSDLLIAAEVEPGTG